MSRKEAGVVALLGALLTGMPAMAEPQRHEGRWFAAVLPTGWQMLETRGGIEVNAPDGSALFLALHSGAGALGPRGCLRETIRRREPLALQHTLYDVAPVPAPAGFLWRPAEAELAIERRGAAFRVKLRCAVLNSYGQYTAVIRGDYLPSARQRQTQARLDEVRDSLEVRDRSALSGLTMADLPDRGIPERYLRPAPASRLEKSEAVSESNWARSKVIAPPANSYQESWPHQSGRLKLP